MGNLIVQPLQELQRKSPEITSSSLKAKTKLNSDIPFLYGVARFGFFAPTFSFASSQTGGRSRKPGVFWHYLAILKMAACSRQNCCSCFAFVVASRCVAQSLSVHHSHYCHWNHDHSCDCDHWQNHW